MLRPVPLRLILGADRQTMLSRFRGPWRHELFALIVVARCWHAVTSFGSAAGVTDPCCLHSRSCREVRAAKKRPTAPSTSLQKSPEMANSKRVGASCPICVRLRRLDPLAPQARTAAKEWHEAQQSSDPLP